MIRISKIRLVMMLLLSFVFVYIDGAIRCIFHFRRKQILRIFNSPFILSLYSFPAAGVAEHSEIRN